MANQLRHATTPCLDKPALPIILREHDPAMVTVIVSVMVILSMMDFGPVMLAGIRACNFLLQLLLKSLLDSWIFTISFNLFYLQGYPQTFGEVPFGHGEVASFGRARIEVLVKPEIRR